MNGVKVLTSRIDKASAQVRRGLADRNRDQLQSGVVPLGAETEDGKALILVAAGFKAGDAIREMAKEVGGSGGGKPDMAQAGGTDLARIPAAFDRLFELVKG